MVIQKGEKEYTVRQTKAGWTVSRTVGGVTVNYKVPVGIAPSAEALTKYVKESELF